ncbi:DNA-binding response regulator, OmpR family, contains REC and winged-helix (wHTH) domain [Seinonella peptonophila]|uniref:DNA-binding response regulator, OmpR family, contains REC and winged-helix (WHTH) domain n=1 Tax=Seinonella peptonophila TaxID=112248 RepID=A0A1M4X3I6_9BACL|nr:response regulator transcription factor [Seinonella peptonophila]SHE87923.1 DNA-binding response regulator, OmpR family, contains REC and winged-helix (wHTH) domain [Seinonella peptonophila]
MFKIFIVEDDEMLVSLLSDFIQKYGYDTYAVKNFNLVMEEFKEAEPHLVLLDINLPTYDGYEWCRRIRTISNCPILFISARDSKMDQVMALEYGADDYLTKPFDHEIALAKIKSQIRRTYGSYASFQHQRQIEINGLQLDIDRLTLKWGMQKVELRHTEAKILDLLMNQIECVVSRDLLLEKIWDDEAFVDENTLNVYIRRVRSKLDQLKIVDAIQTVRGQGYRMLPIWSEQS